MMVFAWNNSNIEHIARHGVVTGEAEFVVRRAKSPYPLSTDGDKLLVWGKTDVGRWLQIIFVFVDDNAIDFGAFMIEQMVEIEAGGEIIRVIHARDLTTDEKRLARKR